jgi:hypothetical protein
MTAKKTKILFLIICTLQLFYLFNFRSGFRYEIIRDPFNENSGISYAVSPEVIESRDILKKYEAIHFNLSKKLKNDVYFYQRSLEFNYPIRINQSSKLVFFSINEDILEKCNVVETGKYLKLTRC